MLLTKGNEPRTLLLGTGSLLLVRLRLLGCTDKNDCNTEIHS